MGMDVGSPSTNENEKMTEIKQKHVENYRYLRTPEIIDHCGPIFTTSDKPLRWFPPEKLVEQKLKNGSNVTLSTIAICNPITQIRRRRQR